MDFDTVREDKQYRATPENGHSLLLLEAQQEQRTFSDYPNLVTCLDTITELYEQSRVSSGQDRHNFTLQELWKWIDDFYRMEVFIFDKEISRYKRFTRSELKKLFIEQIKKLGDPATTENNNIQNGSSMPENGTAAQGGDMNAEDWDM